LHLLGNTYVTYVYVSLLYVFLQIHALRVWWGNSVDCDALIPGDSNAIFLSPNNKKWINKEGYGKG
jgi:hypothetical protein